LAIFSIICFSPYLDLAFVPRGAALGRAFEANALHGGGRRLSVRAVKAAGFAFIGAQRRALTGEAEGSGAEFGQEGSLAFSSAKQKTGIVSALAIQNPRANNTFRVWDFLDGRDCLEMIIPAKIPRC
jgi:hypothetical protein